MTPITVQWGISSNCATGGYHTEVMYEVWKEKYFSNNQPVETASKQAAQAKLCKERAVMVAVVMQFLPGREQWHQQEMQIIQKATINQWQTATATAVTVQWGASSNCVTGGYHTEVIDEFWKEKYFSNNQPVGSASKQAAQAKFCRARAVVVVLPFLPGREQWHQQGIQII